MLVHARLLVGVVVSALLTTLAFAQSNSGGGAVQAASSVALELVAEGFTAPTVLVPAPDVSGRLFVVDQIGVIRVLNVDGQLLEEPFLDVRERMVELDES